MRKRKKKLGILSLAMAAVLVCGMFPAEDLSAAGASAEKEKEEQTDQEEGEPQEIIEIGTAEELARFAEQCFIDSWSRGKWVVLTGDIDLSDMDALMVPVFEGTFDGGGHTISGFHSVGDGYVGGLFRYIGKEGVVKNLNLEGAVEGTEDLECVGSICGVNYGAIQDCSFKGTMRGRDTVGGIAGANEGTGYIKSCIMWGQVAGYDMTGGIAGINHGVISLCENRSGINNDSQWVETDDEMGTGLFLSINATDSDVNLYSGVDTGGIAGYSDGTIADCANYGQVGYEHTGYNIGGIVGRQAGIVSMCRNGGKVYGRKDVGGIAGQMEPYIQVDEAASLRNAVNKLHDLIERTLDDLKTGKDAVKSDFDSLTAYGDAARDSGHSLADQLTGFVDTNMGQLNALSSRMEYMLDQLPAVLDDLMAAQDSFRLFSDSLKGGLGQVGSISGNFQLPSGGNWVVSGNDALGSIPGLDTDSAQISADQVKEFMDKVQSLTQNEDGSMKGWNDLTEEQREEILNEVTKVSGYLGGWMGEVSDLMAELQSLMNSVTSNSIWSQLADAATHLQTMSDSLKSAMNRAKSIVNYINAQSDLRFTVLGEEFDAGRENLNTQLKGISECIKLLSGDASDYSDIVNADLKAVNDQLNVVFQLLADHLSGYTGLSVEEMYEEVDDSDTDAITTGRVEASVNSGIVRGDINIGGIAGSMAIDEEDPEDSAAGSINYSIGRRLIMKCIIDRCVNEGYITAKKDGAGGIVGYMGHGIVVDSESYGSISSTEGDYVGGICGQSLTVIRRCYALCDVTGNKYVGGIAGYADTLKDCYTMVSVEASSGRKGAVAGWTEEELYALEDDTEPSVCRNYYVGGEIRGIDDISYAGIAEPLEYEELLEQPELPSQFRHLKVIYKVGDIWLGSEEVPYGQSLASLHYPDIPEQEGYYGVWPDYSDRVMQGNLVIEGEYRNTVLVVESDNREEEEEEGVYKKPYALVESSFTEDTELKVEMGTGQPPQEVDGNYVLYEVQLKNGGIQEDVVFAVRLLNPYEDAKVWGMVDGVWTELESKVRGQYLQVDMTGEEETFCIAETKSYTLVIAACAAGCAAVVILAAVLAGKLRKKLRSRRKKS